jgi:ketosteroid isomerase-like protein
MKAPSRDFVLAFYDAYVTRDPSRIAPFLHDDVDWMLSGPVALLEFYGPRRGKAAVLELIETIVPRFMDVRKFETEELLVQDERVAAFNRLHGVQQATGRMIAYHCAHFMRLHDGKIIAFRAVCDSFDAAEQMLGHPIDLSRDGKRVTRADVIAV